MCFPPTRTQVRISGTAAQAGNLTIGGLLDQAS
jgi:hypothetical protein